MSARDGDGWVECDCGFKHWGLNGAAGLLLIRDRTVLLQHRAPWVHNGDTWGIPGGARDSHESIFEAALRESHEEIGIEINLVTQLEVFSDNHGNWRYDTVIATAHPDLVAHEQNDESLEIQWVKFEGVASMKLHPSFAKSWPELQALLNKLFI